MDSDKKWWTSKTIWANVIGLGATLLESATQGGAIPGVDLNGPNGVAILAVLNIALRWATSKKILS